MRINNEELDAIRQASQKPSPTNQRTYFTIPKLNKDIPTESTTTDTENKFAKALVACGAIEVSKLPEALTSTRQIIEHGLQTWFNDRVPKLNVIAVSATILPPSVIEKVLIEEDMEGESSERVFNGGFGLSINGPDQFTPMLFGESAMELESEHPGLWKTALRYIDAAGQHSVPIRMPESIYYLNGYLWEDWSIIKSRSSIPKDESVRESLEYHFEGSEEEIDKHLPSAVIKLLGDDLAIPAFSTKKDLLSLKELKEVAKKSTDEFSSITATLLLKLVKATKAAKRAHARMPELSGLNCESTEPGCTLLYQYDDSIYQCLNAHYQELMECGRATHWTGLEELPTDPQELNTYFNKLDLALQVLTALDDLLCHVTTPYIEN